MQIVISFIEQYGYVAVTFLLALGIVGLPVPDETLMLFVGYMSSQHVLNYWVSLGCSFIGSVTGMFISYMIGRKVGSVVIVKYGKWIGLTPKRYAKTKNWFAKYGGWTILFAYYIPGIRHVAGYISGITNMPVRNYLLLSCVGALVWASLFISIGYFFGNRFSF